MESTIIAQCFIIILDLMVALSLWLNYNNLKRKYLLYVIFATLLEALRQTVVLGVTFYPDSQILFWGAGYVQYLSSILLFAALKTVSAPGVRLRRRLVMLCLLFVALPGLLLIKGFEGSVVDYYWYYLPLIFVTGLIIQAAYGNNARWSQGRVFMLVTTIPLFVLRILLPYNMGSENAFIMMYFLESLLYGLSLGVLILHSMEDMHRQIHHVLAERIQAEKDLQFIFDESADAILVTDEAGVFISWNLRGVEQFGYTRDEAIGFLNIQQLLVAEYPASSLTESVEFENVIKHQDGTEVPIKARVKGTIRNEARFSVYILQDVSAEKEMNRQQEVMTQRLEQSQKLESLGVLAGGIAHDFNNLLATIMGYASLAQGDQAEELAGHLDQILKAADKAAVLTSQMLTYAGQGHYDPRPIELNAAAADMLTLLRSSVSKKAQLNFDLCQGEIWFAGETSQIDQIIMNLITNASESIGDKVGQITVSTGSKYVSKPELAHFLFGEDLSAAEFCYISVADTGCGMDKHTLAHLFEPFFSTKFVGRGLGLATVAGIVKRHDAALQVESILGGGTTFTIYFQPCGKPMPVAVTDITQVIDPLGLKILLLDDEPEVLKMARQMLERRGFHIITVLDGETAIEQYQQNRDIDLLLFDCTLPTLSGFETYQKICDLGDKPPVIFLSGYSEDQVSEKIDSNWPAIFVHKPFKQAVLLRSISNLMSSVSR
ncbi:MAG: response regulator [Pseudomonadales bacterium]|nr:response regulator [Pseudomonadales bacterium]